MKPFLKFAAFVLAIVVEIRALALFQAGLMQWEPFLLHFLSGAFFLAALPTGRTGTLSSLPRARWWLGAVIFSMPAVGPLCVFAWEAVCYLVPVKPPAPTAPVLGIPSTQESRNFPGPPKKAESILKILSSPDVNARREAITSLGVEPSPGAVLILQRAVYDSDDYVRTSAQSLLARWSESGEKRIKALEAGIRKDEASTALRLRLAEECMEMVQNRLASSELDRKFLENAVHALHGIPAGDPLHLRSRLPLLRCLVELGRTGEAAAVLSELKAGGFSHPSLQDLECAVLFQQRKWRALRDVMGGLNRKSTTSGPTTPIWQAFLGTA